MEHSHFDLAAWKLEHGGQLPESLDALVPNCLPEVPSDPYDGSPLHYDKRRLWSGDNETTESERLL